jgi:hypothetical protein
MNKIDYLRREIDHLNRLIDISNREAEKSKNHEALMMTFVDQAERLEDQRDGFVAELNAELALVKSAKGKKNAKSGKKRTKRS